MIFPFRHILAFLAALLTIAPLGYVACRRGAFARLGAWWRRSSMAARLAAIVLVLSSIAYGSDKILGEGMGEGLRAIPNAVSTLCTNAFHAIELLTGYVVSSVATNETHDFTPPPSATVVERIARRGAHNDGFWLFDDFTNNFARAGLSHENPVWVHSDGTVTVRSPATGIPIEEVALYTAYSNITVYAPLQGPYGFLPASLWPDCQPSRIWSAVTDRGTRVITWENALLGRDPSSPVSFQAEFHPNGDITYRYSSTPPLLTPNSPASIGLYRHGTPSIIYGAAGAGLDNLTQSPLSPLSFYGNLSTHQPFNLSTIHWSYIGDLGDGTGDFDCDGLTDWQEVMETHTDPHRFDTDGDGLGDLAEIGGGTDPNNPDTDADGLPDGWTSSQYQAHRLLNGGETDRQFTISLLDDTPRENHAVLRIGDLPVLLNTTNSWSFSMPTGTSWSVELLTSGRRVLLAIEAGEGVIVDNNEGIFAQCTTSYDTPPPPTRGGGPDGSPGGSGTIHAPCIFLEPAMQVIHRGETAYVAATCIPSSSDLGPWLDWSFNPPYMSQHVTLSPDRKSATVDGLGDGPWLSSVALHASVGANPPEGLSGTAIVEFCDGLVHLSLEASLSEGHTNATITTSFSGCPHHLDDEEEILLEIEAGRHTASGWQHLAWIDTDTETPGLQIRTAISRANPPELDWNMRAATSAPLADGTDSFVYDGSTTFARALPAAAAGEYVPPPFVTLVARTFDAGGNKLDESSTTLYIPQYVQVTWDAAVIEEFRQQIVFDYPGTSDLTPTNVTLFAGCTTAEATAAFDGIATKVQALFPSGANIVVVGPNVNVPQPHKTVVIQAGKYIYPSNGQESTDLGRTPNEHCHQRNDSPLGTTYAYGGTIREYIHNQFQSFYLDPPPIDIKNDWRNVPLPLSASTLAEVLAYIAMHEGCHAMGLVPTASADEDGHNKCKYGEHYMDGGGTKTLLMRLGFDSWHIQRWKQENADYLRFVFPKGL